MKRLMILSMACATFQGCQYWLDAFGIPTGPVEIPNRYWYYYSADVVVIDSTTGLIIEGSVKVIEDDYYRTTMTHENGQITLYDSCYLETERQPKNYYSHRMFVVDGFRKTDYITIKFHKDSSEYFPQSIYLLPDDYVPIEPMQPWYADLLVLDYFTDLPIDSVRCRLVLSGAVGYTDQNGGVLIEFMGSENWADPAVLVTLSKKGYVPSSPVYSVKCYSNPYSTDTATLYMYKYQF